MKLLGKRIALGIAVLVLGLVLLEIVARSLLRPYADAQFSGDSELQQDLYRLSTTRGYEIIPNANREINALGMRGPERDTRKPEGTFRILVLGDSIAYGAGVDSELTFSGRLEATLTHHHPERSFEVLNAGVVGYNTEQELATLEEWSDRLDPDAVVLAYCPNDIFVTPMVFKDGDGFRLYRPGQKKTLYSAFLVENFALYRLLMFHYEQFRAERSGNFRDVANLDGHLMWDPIANFEALRALCRFTSERDLPLLVLIFPYLKGPFDEYGARDRVVHERVRMVTEQESVSTIDLLLEWGPLDHRSLVREQAPNDFVHPNAKGHRLAARQIRTWLEESGTLDR